MAADIVVIGSINMDLVCRTRVMPAAGQTVLGGELVTIPGGKGANQAVAAARLARRGTSVHMVGRVGDDVFGQRLLQGLRQHRVNTDHVKVTPRTASGVAMILVDQRGENSIVVAPGANAKLTPADVDGAWDVIRRASIVMLQLEIPLKTVRHAVALCRKLNVKTILDPAPMPEKGLPRDLLAVDILTPNETEGRNLHGHSRNMVLKMGSKGSQWVTPDKIFRAKPFRVRVIDTTAAGDAFTGALGVAMAEGMSIEDCLNFANAAGALCCTKLGAQPALPSRREVSLKLRERTK